MGSFGFGGVLRAQGQFIKHNVKPLFGGGGTNTRTKNYLTVGPSELPWNPRSPKGTKRRRSRERELDLRRQFIERQGGMEEYMRGLARGSISLKGQAPTPTAEC